MPRRLVLPDETNGQDAARLQAYIDSMPMNAILGGLEFAQARWNLQHSGALRVGRKGIVDGEVHAVTAEQARWRLDHWKMMIADYRRRGYSYPTISRIKKRLRHITYE